MQDKEFCFCATCTKAIRPFISQIQFAKFSIEHWPSDDLIVKTPLLYCPSFVYRVADTLFIINDGNIW